MILCLRLISTTVVLAVATFIQLKIISGDLIQKIIQKIIQFNIRGSFILVKSEECPKLAQKASKLDQKMGLLSNIENIHSIYDSFVHFMKQCNSKDYLMSIFSGIFNSKDYSITFLQKLHSKYLTIVVFNSTKRCDDIN